MKPYLVREDVETWAPLIDWVEGRRVVVPAVESLDVLAPPKLEAAV
jgi:hypothetical protein